MRALRQLPLVLMLIAAAWAGWKFVLPLFKPEVAEMDVQTTSVQRGDLRDVVPADGVIEPSALVEVKSKASGVVEKIMVEPGDQVKQGDILVELDKEQLLADLRQAEADLAARRAQFALTKRSLTPQQKASNESNVRQAQLALDRAQEAHDTQQAAFERINELFEKGYATQAEFDDARSALDAAENTLEQARESLESTREQVALDAKGAEPETIEVSRASIIGAETQVANLKEELGYTTVRAPIDGTVLSRPVELGTAVASGTSGNTGGTVVATVGDLQTLYVKAQIEETDIGKVRKDVSCRISFDAYAGWVWQGKVDKVYPYPSETNSNQGFGSNAARYPVDIAIDLKSGTQDGDAPGAGGAMMRMGGGGGNRGGGGRGGGNRGGGNRGGGKTGGKGEPGAGKDGAPDKPKAPELLPKMTATAEIVLEDHPQVLWIPAQFIKYDKGKPYAEVITGGQEAVDKAREADGGAKGSKTGNGNRKLNDKPEAKLPRERHELEIGYSDGVRTEVKSGLDESDVVYLERPIKENQFR